MQRSITVKIIRPVDETISWKKLGFLLHGLSLKACLISNFCMTHQLLHALKVETKFLNPQGHLYCYPHLAKKYPDVPAGIVCAAETRARKLFQRYALSVLRSESSLPNFRKNSNIPIPVAGYKIQKGSDNHFYAEVQLLSRYGAKIQNLPCRIRLVVADNWRDKSAKGFLQQLADGKLKKGVASLFRDRKNWYFSIPYVIEAKNLVNDFEPGLVMGVTFGLYDVLVYGFNTSLKRGAISGGEILSHQKKLNARRKMIQEQYSWSGRKGHGRKRALKPLRHLYETEKNFRSLINNRYAKWIVETAARNRCGKIHLEANTNTQSQNKGILLTRWPIYDLKSKIRRKAEEKGIQVMEYAVFNFRTRCSNCGQELETESNKRMFLCSKCGFGTVSRNSCSGFISADYNAARNLALYETVDNDPVP